MENLERILAEHRFFRNLDPQHLAILVGCASNVRLDPGEFFLREGEEANAFYLIRHGQAALEISSPSRGPIIIEMVGEGEVIGWSWLIPPYRWHFDARATSLVRAIALDGKCLRDKCEADHDLGYELLKRFSTILEERLQSTRLQLLDVYADHA